KRALQKRRDFRGKAKFAGQNFHPEINTRLSIINARRAHVSPAPTPQHLGGETPQSHRPCVFRPSLPRRSNSVPKLLADIGPPRSLVNTYGDASCSLNLHLRYL